MFIKTDEGVKEIQTVSLIRDKVGKLSLQLIDQRYLPHKLIKFETNRFSEAISAIKDMVVRGAPAIGITGAYALVLGLQELQETKNVSKTEIYRLKDEIVKARPTAKDLETFIYKIIEQMEKYNSFSLRFAKDQAIKLSEKSKQECYEIGKQAKHLILENTGILTHCNAGALATVDYGTALSPMRLAHYEGIKFTVYVDETRPRLQGMITAWELLQEGIDHVIIVDNAAGFFMQQGKIQLVITGCDRVLSNGTVTNKIGTLEKAVLAKEFGIPFYVAMPWTTFDPDLHSASEIPIEYRKDDEITHIQSNNESIQVSPIGSPVSNPAFDITNKKYITGYITKDGILDADQLMKYYKLQNQVS